MTAGAHETYTEFREVPLPSNRNFGVTIGLILICFAAARWWFGNAGAATIILAASGTCLFLLGIVAPVVLAPFNRGWMKFGLLLAAIVNPLIMLLIFILFFVPVGLAMQAFRRDELQLARKPRDQSYWNDRALQRRGEGTLLDQTHTGRRCCGISNSDTSLL